MFKKNVVFKNGFIHDVILSLLQHQFSFYDNGTVRDMMKTPSVTCQKTSASSKLSTSWMVNTAGVILFLFQITAM